MQTTPEVQAKIDVVREVLKPFKESGNLWAFMWDMRLGLAPDKEKELEEFRKSVQSQFEFIVAVRDEMLRIARGATGGTTPTQGS